MTAQPVRRSRLAKQENKRILRQTILILVATVAFLILFFWVGIPSLIKLAVALGNAKAASKFSQDDTMPPLPPQFILPLEATTSASLTIDGFAEAGAIITLFHNQTEGAQTTVDNQGNFSFATIVLEDGENRLYTIAKDLAGNQSQPSPTQTIALDNTPPQLTISQPADGSQIYGSLNQLTDISGTTDPGSIVVVNDRQIVVIGDGTFTTKYELSEGVNTLNFTATDPAGNQTTQTITVSFAR